MVQISLRVEFSGGLELLFGNKRSHKVVVPASVSPSSNNGDDDGGSRPTDMQYLIFHLRDNLLQERPELFVENGTVRPGILVLINDTDWELEGEGAYELKDDDEIVFLSTLHGG